MEHWINQALNAGHPTAAALVAVFLLGMISVVTCGCNFAILGAVAGYSGAASGNTRSAASFVRGIAFLAGGVVAMALIGALLGYAGNRISASFGNYWKLISGLLMIFFGIYTLDWLPFRLPGLKLTPGTASKGLLPAIIFGFAIGGLSAAMNSCCNPVFPVILAASFLKGSTFWGLVMLTIFATGYGLPLAVMIIGIDLGAGKLSRILASAGKIVQYAGGGALILFGFYLLLTM